MCRGKDMNVMVMDVEGTDGRERGEDQVWPEHTFLSLPLRSHVVHRILKGNLLCSPSLRPKSSSLTFGNTK
jgi:Root hair defective 3 GTP-binding protein (RHD3)